MMGSDKVMTGLAYLVQRTEDDRTGRVLSNQTIERSGDTVYGLHSARGDEEHWFFG
jgi:hypothetical protein